jgi:hypothetical protein
VDGDNYIMRKFVGNTVGSLTLSFEEVQLMVNL